MKDTLRLFVAAALPTGLKDFLAGQAGFYQSSSLRPVPPQNLHLTLYFLGSTAPEALPGIEEKLEQVAARHSPFELTLQCLEPGPKPKAPRLVWARFRSCPVFEQLVRDLTQQLTPQPLHLRKPLAHITLARFRKEKAAAAPALPLITPPGLVTLPVSSFGLWQSELTSPHPIYWELRNFELGTTQPRLNQ